MAKIIISNVFKSFNNKEVLKNLNLEVNEGEIFAYIGPNGAGKTTTIRILLKVLKPDKGEVKILDKENTSLEKNKIGFVLENENPFENFTPEEYLKFYADVYKIKREENIKEILERLNLYERRKEKIYIFSKGMKRKLCIAKAILCEPDILFLDEPFEGIEIEARREIKEVLLELKKKMKIIFLTSHNLYEIEPLCTSFGIIINGVLKGKWNKKDLKDINLEEFYFKIKNENSY